MARKRVADVLQSPDHTDPGLQSLLSHPLCALCLPCSQVALKRVADVLQSPDHTKRVLREICILRRLHHPNLIALRDAFVRPSATGQCRLIKGKLVNLSVVSDVCAVGCGRACGSTTNTAVCLSATGQCRLIKGKEVGGEPREGCLRMAPHLQSTVGMTSTGETALAAAAAAAAAPHLALSR